MIVVEGTRHFVFAEVDGVFQKLTRLPNRFGQLFPTRKADGVSELCANFCVRNPEMFRRLGPDTGFDAIRGDAGSGLALGRLLDRIAETAELPKTILYSLNPADNAQIGAILGCFQGPEARGKLQQGCAWWFNDSVKGMREQLTSLASLSVLGNFVGMVTDSRSFLSYPRHEYFRRLLCAVLGAWVEAGEYPADYETLGELVKDISYRNAAAFFED